MPFYEFRVDLYGFSRRNRRTIAVELKMHKWRRAFEQALLYQLCADLVYIAMPLTYIGRVDTELLRKYGIGLVAVRDGSGCRQVVEAEQSDVVQRIYKMGYVARLRNGGANG